MRFRFFLWIPRSRKIAEISPKSPVAYEAAPAKTPFLQAWGLRTGGRCDTMGGKESKQNEEEGESVIHSVLLLGQSNMAGRGYPKDVEPIRNDGIFVSRNGIFRPMYVPVNPDRKTSGICLAESFADAYTGEKGVPLGLIPCADGGSSLDQWMPGEILFDHAVFQARLAQRTSRIVGVLWHQGESDCFEETYPFYEEKLGVILGAFREKLNLEKVPFLLGGLGDYLENCEKYPECKNFFHINAALERFAEKNPMTGFVSARGLASNPDRLHFSAAALREFGVRYYQAFLKLEVPFSTREGSDGVPAPRKEIELL